MRCPNCGSENVNLIYNTSKRGFKGSDACCGYVLLGPLGLLCGALGSGKKDTSEFWLCNNCGSRFQNKDIVKYNQNIQNNYTDNNIEEQLSEPNEIIEQPLLLDNSSNKEDICAPKIIFDKAEPYSGGLSIESLLKRAALFLEDGEWEKAYEYSENAIDIDACCAEAYLFKFMAEYTVNVEERIPSECFYMIEKINSLTDLENYKKAYRFGNEEMRLKLEKYSNQAVYNYADELAQNAHSATEYLNAAEIFEKISEYSDSAERAENCKEKIRSEKYSNALKIMNSAENAEEAEQAKIAFDQLGNYKDSKQKAVECLEKCKELKYNSACRILDSAESDKDVDIAENMFKKLGDYKDSKEKFESCPNRKIEIKYNNACHILETAQSVAEIRCAQSLLEEIQEYKDASEKAAGCDKLCDDFNYAEACKILENAKRVKDIDKAVDLFKQVQNHDDLNERLDKCSKKRIEIQNNFNRLLKISLICAGTLIFGITLILVISSIPSKSEDKETAETTEEIISETGTEITTVSAIDEITTITSSEAVTTETSRVSETTITETTEQVRKNVSNKKETFNFNGGYIDYTEYTYYNSDPDYPQEYINFSAKIKLDNYPDSENRINDFLAEIGKAPTAEMLLNSKAPEKIGYGMMAEHNQLSSVYAENTLLFITTDYLWDGGGGLSMSIIGYNTNYVFDLKTGKQIKGTQLFNDLESVKKIVIDYADKYIKENIPYEDYADQPYYEQLVESEWYNGSWTYDGKKFTVLYMYLLPGYMYKNIYVEIPAEVIKPYFVSESEREKNSGTTKLTDIVGPGVYQYAPAPDITVDVSLADISQNDYRILMYDLEHCVDMGKSIIGRNESSFNYDVRLLGTDDSYGDTIYYYATDYNNADELFNDARKCFSENFISTNDLIDMMFEGNFPAFLSVDGQVAWSFYPPNPSSRYDFHNAGVVSYSDTNAEVWVSESSSIEATFSVRAFKMIRYDLNDNWKIDRVQEVNYTNFDNAQEIGFNNI